MKKLLLLALLLTTQGLFAYSIEDYMEDATRNPTSLFESLHPDSKAYLKSQFQAMREGKYDLNYIFFGRNMSGIRSMSDVAIWKALWESSMGNNLYDPDKMQLLGNWQQEDLMIYLIQDKAFHPEHVVDAIVFKQFGTDYLPMVPQAILVSIGEPVTQPTESDSIDALRKTSNMIMGETHNPRRTTK